MERRDALNRMRTDQLERLNAALASRYAIERELGSGGMATVYLAQRLEERTPNKRDQSCGSMSPCSRIVLH